ncbi:hypothetical protein ETB97_011247 [Aspergillus alliaceus]|uniref:N-acetyltransferase domain-containing protein n=1 Tax=Petromyces alliaceus TaxID=209559 RepID=A0A5N7CNB9_PETAA|nr:hypothetical protein BDV23DRAFT_194287 [Aspergillus alliaceus]KAF5862705.1 hypothetical protein ETB97_011247 [Aspergillus burnettii]
MSTASYTIRPVQASDIPALADLLYTSKLSLTINRLLFKEWPNEAIQRQNYFRAVDSIDKSEPESLTVVDKASGEIIGHLAFNRRLPVQKLEEPKPETGKQDLPDFFNPEVVTAVLSAVAELKQDTKSIDHYELTYIIVKPGYRHRGIGRDLIKYVFDKAKSAAVPVIVNAEPQTYDFFKKYRFEDTKHVDFELDKWAPPYSGFGVFRLAGMAWHP